jgi:uncharacterized repeat protein (TIGR01451 family)
MGNRTRLGAALGAGALTFGIAGISLAGNVGNLGGGPRLASAVESCGIVPLDVELVMDTSGSMGNNSSNGKTRLEWAVKSAKQLVDNLDGSGLNVGGSGHRVGLTRFSGTTATVVTSLGDADGASDVKDAIDTLGSNGNTPLDAGMAAGAADLSGNARADVKQIVILLSDGRPWVDQGPNGTWASSTFGPRPTSAEGDSYLDAADVAISVALGNGGSNGTANELDLALMTLIGPDGAYHVVNGDELPDVFSSIYEQIACPPPHLVAAKAVDKETAGPGETLHYTISLSNDGGSDATGVEVHDDITSLLAHGSFNSCDNGCTNDADSVDWTGLTVPDGTSMDLHFSIDLDVDGWPNGTTELPNTVVVPESNCKAESQDPDCAVLTTVTVEEEVAETTTEVSTTTTEETTTFESSVESTTSTQETTSFESTEASTTTSSRITVTQPPTDTLAPASGQRSGMLWFLVAAIGAIAGCIVVLAPSRKNRD